MKKLLVITLMTIMVISCGNMQEEQQEKLPDGMHSTVVKEVIPADSYTYLNVEEKGKDYWIAVRAMDVKPGEKVYFSKTMEMKDFHSKTLDRTFESILFVEDAAKTLTTTGGLTTLPSGHPDIKKNKVINSDINIDTPDGFIKIAEVFKNKNNYSGKTIKIKGKVVKYNPQIMGRNWIHIQDGSDFEGKNDLLVTSNESTKVGEVISIEGKLVLDKDFGAGYKYELLVEEAKIIK